MLRQGSDSHWLSYDIKIGMIIMLLLWSISECFNNEKFGQDIWTVSPHYTALIYQINGILLMLFFAD